LIVAAAGNSPVEHLLAPAQAPSILTVGGVDDQNRAVDPADPAEIALYHHGYGRVAGPHGLRQKPDLLAPAAWLAGPILPVSPIFREMHAIDRLRATLRASLDPAPDDLVAHWQRVMHGAADEDEVTGEWMGDVWQAVRRRMNTHKWVHACYQHVDGTSVAAAVVSGVAAQMVQANPHLDAAALRAILCATALPLPHLPAEKRGAGLIQPAAAVAAALRAPGGRLAGLPHSGSVIPGNELQKWVDAGRVPLRTTTGSKTTRALYVGLDAPQARAVRLTGSFDGWRTDSIALERTDRGWWHAAVLLPPGDHLYRFWVEEKDGSARWIGDPEHGLRAESGFAQAHSRAVLAA
jgi:serine protease AprX